jgi:ribonuclease P protein component
VSRNRVKRLVREVFRRNRPLFPEGTDLVIVAKKGAPTLSYEQVLQEMQRANSAMRAAARRGKQGAMSEAPGGR